MRSAGWKKKNSGSEVGGFSFSPDVWKAASPNRLYYYSMSARLLAGLCKTVTHSWHYLDFFRTVPSNIISKYTAGSDQLHSLFFKRTAFMFVLFSVSQKITKRKQPTDCAHADFCTKWRLLLMTQRFYQQRNCIFFLTEVQLCNSKISLWDRSLVFRGENKSWSWFLKCCVENKTDPERSPGGGV